MTSEKTSKTAQGVMSAQELQTQFNIVTKDLFSEFGYENIKPDIDNLLLGWIDSDHFENLPKRYKVTGFDFFTKLLTFFQKAEVEHENNREISINLFIDTITANFEHNSKGVNKHFNRALLGFIESEIANCNNTRNDVFYRAKSLKKYFKKVYKIIDAKPLQSS